MSASSNSEYERAKAKFKATQALKRVEHQKKREAEKKAEEDRKAAEIAAAAEKCRVEVAIRVDKRGKNNGGKGVGAKKGWRIIPDSGSESESGTDQVLDSDKEAAGRRCTVCIKRDVPCIWNKVSESHSFGPLLTLGLDRKV